MVPQSFDPIDEAADESFPASDPPAWTGTHAGGATQTAFRSSDAPVTATKEYARMPRRPRLDEELIAPAPLAAMESFHADVVREVEQAVRRDQVVVVGMAQNPHVRRVRQALDAAGVTYTYLEYGSYFSRWRDRLAIKLWSGWPTFPQVFVNGALIGGEDLTKAALADGSLHSSVAPARARATA
jgi:glutaredoxin-related protein